MEILPNYLKSIADDINYKQDSVEFKIKCSCGNRNFSLYQNISAKNSFDEYWDSQKFPIFSICSKFDKKGQEYYYGKTFFGLHVGKFYVKNMPKKEFKIIIAKCSQCKTEYVIFDNRKHGYDALVNFNKENNKIDISSSNKKFVDNGKLKLKIINNLNFDQLKEDLNNQLSLNEFSEAFSSLSIYVKTKNKYKCIYDEETQ